MLGTVILPIIHYSVKKWGGIHPTVVTQGGGGLGHPDMKIALTLGFVAMTFLAVVLLWSRARLALALEPARRRRRTRGRARPRSGVVSAHQTTAHRRRAPARKQFVPVEGGAETTSAEALLVAAYLVMWALFSRSSGSAGAARRASKRALAELEKAVGGAGEARRS